MSLLLGAAGLLCLFLTGCFLLVFRKLSAAGTRWAEGECLDEVRPGRYRPMARLLDEQEYHRLQASGACGRRMLRRFRASRVRLFRAYLRALSADHSRVCHLIKLLMVESAQDRPDLARFLVRQRVAFTLWLMVAEYRLCLHALGIGSVQSGRLVAALDTVRLELSGLMAAAQPAAA